MQEYQYKQKKRRLLIFSILGICLFLFLRWEPIQWTLWAMTLAIRDIGRSPNMKADDAISKAIYQEMGDSVYYKGKRETVEGATKYCYELYTEQTGQIEAIQRTANEVIERENLQNKIELEFDVEFVHNAWGAVAYLYNYEAANSTEAEYRTLKRCSVLGEDKTDTIYNDPVTYKNLSGIVWMEISEELWNASKEQGIEWFEWFPELKKVKVVY